MEISYSFTTLARAGRQVQKSRRTTTVSRVSITALIAAGIANDKNNVLKRNRGPSRRRANRQSPRSGPMAFDQLTPVARFGWGTAPSEHKPDLEPLPGCRYQKIASAISQRPFSLRPIMTMQPRPAYSSPPVPERVKPVHQHAE